jgi:hypothetical protein
MDIILLENWGGAEIGAPLVVDQTVGDNLIQRGIAKETEKEVKISARKGAAKSSGKDDES